MDLWIRSQDREILRVNPELELFKYGKETFLVIDTKGCTSYDKAKVLGKYKNKTRALEVLDEIQESQLGNYHYRCPSNVKVNNNENIIVYEMPEE